ncbi:unnamed protein product [Callosobruchus maculatus]|uniref:PiggyBac transposable element-derived protein domain-containing protein n=1 Tax=Callosobruchus maculatus TaxID=64391 RepID=A0A653C7J7_CALMS|nr:unnamed protein product [Callosobruchus maculatus]
MATLSTPRFSLASYIYKPKHVAWLVVTCLCDGLWKSAFVVVRPSATKLYSNFFRSDPARLNIVVNLYNAASTFYLGMNCPYEKERQRLLRLFEEVNLEDEQPDDEEDEDTEDCVETREDSDTEQEGENEDGEEFESQGAPYFTAKDGTQWNKHPFSQRVRTAKVNKVSDRPGVKGEAKNAKTPLDCWNLFFSEQMLASIVENTNIYIEAISPNYQRSRDARPTNLPEIKALFGLLYLAGIHKSSRLNTEELWSRDGTGIDLFWLTMSLQRFRFLMRVIRTDNKNTREKRCKKKN